MTNLPLLVFLSVTTSGASVQLRPAYANIINDPFAAMQLSRLLNSFEKHLETEDNFLNFLTSKSWHFQNLMGNMLVNMAAQSALITFSQANILRQGLNALDKNEAAAGLSLMTVDAFSKGGPQTTTLGPIVVPEENKLHLTNDHDPYDPTSKCLRTTSFGRLYNAQTVSRTMFMTQLINEYTTNYVKARTSELNVKTINLGEDDFMISIPLMLSVAAVRLPGYLQYNNRTTWLMEAANFTCWAPTWLNLGPQTFKWDLVAPRLADPMQPRGYFQATIPQTENFLWKSSFMFSNGQEHKDTRLLLQTVGFAATYPVDLDQVRSISKIVNAESTESDIESILGPMLIPVIMKALFGAELPPEVVRPHLTEYVKYSKYVMFGRATDFILSKIVVKPPFFGQPSISGTIKAARKAVTQWSLDTPFAKKFHDAYHKSSYRYRDFETLMAGMIDAILISGLVPTIDLTEKCLVYQLRDSKHKKMFEASPEMYLLELMRYDAAITSITVTLPADTDLTMDGSPVTLAKGSPSQLILAAANRDHQKFFEPLVFNPERKDAKYNLAWNGQLDHVEARDLTKAPRHCPGQCLSVKVASNVCAKLMGSWEKLIAEGKLNNELHCNHFS